MEDLIYKQNPWWSGERDYHLEKWKAMKLRWVPKWIESVSLKPFSLNFVIGPRQVGKTTGIKLLIREILKKERPESVFYFDCTILPDVYSLKAVLDKYLSIREAEGIKSCFIFLDEVTTVSGWWRVVKGYVDMGVFKNDVITVTGSSSLKLKGEVELFPGRRGFGRDVTVLPLTFNEFLWVKGVKVERAKDVRKGIENLWRVEKKVRKEFLEYMECGGYPASINKQPTSEYELISSFEGEILRIGKSLALTKGIIGSLMRKAPSPLSFTTVGKDVGVSYKTVQEYVEILESLFVLGVSLFKSNGIKWRKERKFFFLDPFLAKVLSMWSSEECLESALYEWVVQSHLARRFGSVYYFRNRFEIDCIANGLRVEVKVGKPHRRYPRDVLILDKENLPLFLATL